jgi:hypothetical protein
MNTEELIILPLPAGEQRENVSSSITDSIIRFAGDRKYVSE